MNGQQQTWWAAQKSVDAIGVKASLFTRVKRMEPMHCPRIPRNLRMRGSMTHVSRQVIDQSQLTLKEGLTVFRDQEFTADQMAAGVDAQAAGSVRAVQRIRRLRPTGWPLR